MSDQTNRRPRSQINSTTVAGNLVEKPTLRIRTLAAADAQGGRSTFQFSNFKENVGLADKIFDFKPPRGADVVHSGASR